MYSVNGNDGMLAFQIEETKTQDVIQYTIPELCALMSVSEMDLAVRFGKYIAPYGYKIIRNAALANSLNKSIRQIQRNIKALEKLDLIGVTYNSNAPNAYTLNFEVCGGIFYVHEDIHFYMHTVIASAQLPPTRKLPHTFINHIQSRKINFKTGKRILDYTESLKHVDTYKINRNVTPMSPLCHPYVMPVSPLCHAKPSDQTHDTSVNQTEASDQTPRNHSETIEDSDNSITHDVLNDVLKLNLDVPKEQKNHKFFRTFYSYTHSSYTHKKLPAFPAEKTGSFFSTNTTQGKDMGKQEKEEGGGIAVQQELYDTKQEETPEKGASVSSSGVGGVNHFRPKGYLPMHDLVPDSRVTNHILLSVIEPMKRVPERIVRNIDGRKVSCGVPKGGLFEMSHLKDEKPYDPSEPVIQWYEILSHPMVPHVRLPHLIGALTDLNAPTRWLTSSINEPYPLIASRITGQNEILKHTSKLWYDLWKHLTGEDDYRLRGILKAKRSKYRQYILDWWEVCAEYDIKPAEWLVFAMKKWRKLHRYKLPQIRAILNADRIENTECDLFIKDAKTYEMGGWSFHNQYTGAYCDLCAKVELNLKDIWKHRGARIDDETIRRVVDNYFPNGLEHIHANLRQIDSELNQQKHILSEMVKEGRFIWSVK
jgi:hypothetical protein